MGIVLTAWAEGVVFLGVFAGAYAVLPLLGLAGLLPRGVCR